ncbi:MAG: hypothetical protein EOO09_09325 [Chitinophagaceae bacterium]|nr:MAG: hypothetical protein EOO09_09325 [Chitinophagaceae bacterium]
MIFKKDNLQLGLVLGLLGPLIGLLVIYFAKFGSTPFSVFLSEFFSNNAMITSFGSLALLANVILFTLYVNTRRDRTAKGIFLVTLVYGIVILVLKVLN